ncbi:hypothetical protein G6F43_006673 [Rhizopus delemar]|nr:hypothetical protein G6F43_006673 [Rhizopus delemar]
MNGDGHQDLGDLLNQQGITNKEHLNIYLQLIKHASPFTYLDCLLKTTEKEMLNNLAESDDVANILYQALTESWHQKEKKTLALILKTLNNIPFPVRRLAKCKLGVAIKELVNDTLGQDDDIHMAAKQLKIKWMKLLKANDSTKAQPSASTPIQKKPEIRLAIDKEPPASKLAVNKEPSLRAMALADHNFMAELLKEPPKQYRTRPVYHNENVADLLQTKQSNSVSSEPTTPTAAFVPQLPTRSPPATPKKSVKFADKLYEIREYTPDPEEWANFDAMGQPVNHEYGNAHDMDVQEAHVAFNMSPSLNWYRPRLIAIDPSIENICVRKPILTQESQWHERRERTALAAVYLSQHHIPFSPAEPDEVPDMNLNVPIIPIVDIDIPESSADPGLVQPIFHPPAFHPSTAPNPPHPQAPSYQPHPPVERPKVSERDIDALLKNNPTIMSSLKQLSFLHTGATKVNPASQGNLHGIRADHAKVSKKQVFKKNNSSSSSIASPHYY